MIQWYVDATVKMEPTMTCILRVIQSANKCSNIYKTQQFIITRITLSNWLQTNYRLHHSYLANYFYQLLHTQKMRNHTKIQL